MSSQDARVCARGAFVGQMISHSGHVLWGNGFSRTGNPEGSSAVLCFSLVGIMIDGNCGQTDQDGLGFRSGTPFVGKNRQRLRRGGDHEKAGCSAVCRCSGPGGIRIGSLQGKGGRESQLLRQYHCGGTDHGGVYRRQGSKGRLHANLHLQVSRHRAHRVLPRASWKPTCSRGHCRSFRP